MRPLASADEMGQSGSKEQQAGKSRRSGAKVDEENAVLTGVSQAVLYSLKKAAELAPLPYIKDAAGLAVELLSMAQEVQDNKAGFRSLAADACGLVFAAMGAWKDQERDDLPLSSDLVRDLGELLETLTRVHQFAFSRTRRRWIIRFITVNTDAGKIAGYQREIKDALDRFSMQSSVSIRGSVTRIEDQQQDILAALVRRHSPAYATINSDNVSQASEQRSPPDVSSVSQKIPPVERPLNQPVQTPTDYTTSPPLPPLPRAPAPQPFSAFGNIVSNDGGTFTSIAGDYVVSNNSTNTTSHNSGNVVNVSTTNSNNSYTHNVGNGYGSHNRANPYGNDYVNNYRPGKAYPRVPRGRLIQVD